MPTRFHQIGEYVVVVLVVVYLVLNLCQNSHVTSGDEDGVIIEIDDAATNGVLTIDASVRSRNQFGSVGEGEETVKLEVAIDELRNEGRVWQLEGLDRGIEIRPMGTDYPDQVSVDWSEPEQHPGPNAYWVKVTQVDGATAWSSPIYVRR